MMDCVKGFRQRMNDLPADEVRYLQDLHNGNLFSEDLRDEEDRFDSEKEWPDHITIIDDVEFFNRYVL